MSGTLVPPTAPGDPIPGDHCDHGKRFWNCRICAEDSREQGKDPEGNKRKK